MTMNSIEGPVAREAGDDDPGIHLEPADGRRHEGDHHHGFRENRLNRSGHRGKQDVVRRDHHQHGRIERAIAIEADASGHRGHAQRESESSQQRQYD
jgi:hypothetical protein